MTGVQIGTTSMKAVFIKLNWQFSFWNLSVGIWNNELFIAILFVNTKDWKCSNLASRTIVKLWFTHTVVSYTLQTLRKKKKSKTLYDIGYNFQDVF